LHFTALAMPGSVSAQTPEHPTDNSAQFPPTVIENVTMSGAILPPDASVERRRQSAAAFYRSALGGDPKNNEL